MTHELMWERHGVVVKYWGRVTLNETLRAQAAYQSHARFEYFSYIIINTLDVTEVTAQSSDAEEVWVQDAGGAQRNKRIRKAFIAKLAAAIEFAESYRANGYGAFPLEIFDNESDARRWLAE